MTQEGLDQTSASAGSLFLFELIDEIDEVEEAAPRPILISFSFRLVSDQSLIGSGVASVRKKLPRL
jgi:hypothetical protein